MPAEPNLFDGRLAVFIAQPHSIAETSLGQLAANLRAAPNVNAVIVQTHVGVGWAGRCHGGRPNLALRGPGDLQRWVHAFASQGLECHAWCVVRGSLPGCELDRLAEVCLQGGVRSLLLGLERASPSRPAGFVGGEATAHALALRLRQRVGPGFHLGLLFDPFGPNPRELFVASAWYPEVDSLHPMVFHRRHSQSAAQALQACYDRLQSWGRPIYPVLQAYDVPAGQTAEALCLAGEKHSAAGASLFYYGTGNGNGLDRRGLALAASRWPGRVPVRLLQAKSRRGDAVGPNGPPGLRVVDPDDERSGLFSIGYYGDAAQLASGWTRDRDSNGHTRLYRAASYMSQTLYVGYVPRLAGRGLYSIEVFVPRTHAHVRDAHYFIVDYPRGIRRESLAVLDQSRHFDVWAPLRAKVTSGPQAGEEIGDFELDPAFPDAGRVNVADVTFVDPGSGRFEISFGAVRWRPAEKPAPGPAPGGFDSPVGTEAERAGPFADGRRLFDRYGVWCGQWYDANPIGSRYSLGDRWAIHTGADLNLNGPGGVLADKDAPVYAIAAGRVVSAGFVSTGWTNVIIIEHPVPGEDRVVYARYAHVTNLLVRANDVVERGQQICSIGQYAPNNYHLHFDISADPILKSLPGHWPGDNLAAVKRYYLDPMEFIKRRHVVR